MEKFLQFLFSSIYTVPFLLVSLAGIGISLKNYGKMPKAARLSLTGCSLFLCYSLIHIFSNAWMIFWFYSSSNGKDTNFLVTVTSIAAAVAVIFGAAGFVFLLAAIFSRKDDSSPI